MSVSRRKKIKRFVIDTNVWVSWCISGQLEWLTHYTIQNKLLIYASPDLLSEIKKVLRYPRVKKLLHKPVSFYTNIITRLVLVKEDIFLSINSPDPEDDYLFSLTISTNAKAFVWR